ncbi:RNA polymerase II elongation factor ELL-like [Thalassophryne amazonica]|uniref:RNA polymerase II elongation factor ELL-like n=1 Tax=Thalassophryne amazonica TaxID=390379 RepID=UPI0014725930|nr:RNA polymerase II elongation factor ELL-like [Thalassophryne amazonica]
MRQEVSYGLSGAKISKNTANQSLYHVKLTDSAIQMLETFQNLKTSLSNQPTICFKENQVYMKIPAPTPDAPDATRIIRFNLSSGGSENPQSSLECIQQYVSGDDSEHLESKGHIQGKMTMCGTEQSFQTMRENLTQMENASHKHSAIEIERRPIKFRKVQRKQSLKPGSHSSSSSSSSKRSQVLSPVARWPLRDWIIHRLALRPHKKPDLLLWLERERVGSEDMAELTSVLEEETPIKLRPVQRSGPEKTEDIGPACASTGALSRCGTSGSPHSSALSSADLHKGHTGENVTATVTSATPLPDYADKYGIITTLEQRQMYEEEFDAEYHEYQVIHDWIAAATEKFVQLSSELDALPPGTEAYQRMQDHVLEKYRIYQQWFPGYQEDKRKYVYLHHKLVHLKDRITTYDQAQETRIQASPHRDVSSREPVPGFRSAQGQCRSGSGHEEKTDCVTVVTGDKLVLPEHKLQGASASERTAGDVFKVAVKLSGINPLISVWRVAEERRLAEQFVSHSTNCHGSHSSIWQRMN